MAIPSIFDNDSRGVVTVIDSSGSDAGIVIPAVDQVSQVQDRSHDENITYGLSNKTWSWQFLKSVIISPRFNINFSSALSSQEDEQVKKLKPEIKTRVSKHDTWPLIKKICVVLLVLCVIQMADGITACKDMTESCAKLRGLCNQYPAQGNLWNKCKETCGVCVGGSKQPRCTKGYQGDLCYPCITNYTNECLQGCPNGRRGYSCEQQCDPGCLNACERWTGKCHTGCKLGYFGDNCERTCHNCIGSNCSRDGVCRQGCKVPWHGEECTEHKVTKLDSLDFPVGKSNGSLLSQAHITIKISLVILCRILSLE